MNLAELGLLAVVRGEVGEHLRLGLLQVFCGGLVGRERRVIEEHPGRRRTGVQALQQVAGVGGAHVADDGGGGFVLGDRQRFHGPVEGRVGVQVVGVDVRRGAAPFGQEQHVRVHSVDLHAPVGSRVRPEVVRRLTHLVGKEVPHLEAVEVRLRGAALGGGAQLRGPWVHEMGRAAHGRHLVHREEHAQAHRHHGPHHAQPMPRRGRAGGRAEGVDQGAEGGHPDERGAGGDRVQVIGKALLLQVHRDEPAGGDGHHEPGAPGQHPNEGQQRPQGGGRRADLGWVRHPPEVHELGRGVRPDEGVHARGVHQIDANERAHVADRCKIHQCQRPAGRSSGRVAQQVARAFAR